MLPSIILSLRQLALQVCSQYPTLFLLSPFFFQPPPPPPPYFYPLYNPRKPYSHARWLRSARQRMRRLRVRKSSFTHTGLTNSVENRQKSYVGVYLFLCFASYLCMTITPLWIWETNSKKMPNDVCLMHRLSLISACPNALGGHRAWWPQAIPWNVEWSVPSATCMFGALVCCKWPFKRTGLLPCQSFQSSS